MGNQKQKWTAEEEEALLGGVAKHGPGKWKNILKDPEFAPFLTNRSNIDLKVTPYLPFHATPNLLAYPLSLLGIFFFFFFFKFCLVLWENWNLFFFLFSRECFCNLGFTRPVMVSSNPKFPAL